MIIAIGFATFLPYSDGAVPWGASDITVPISKSSLSDRRTDSAPAIDPNSGSTMSDRQSPSRLSAGITSGASAAPPTSPAYVASIRTGWYGTSGWRSDAASSSSLSIPSYVGLTVHFGPPYTRPWILLAVDRKS